MQGSKDFGLKFKFDNTEIIAMADADGGSDLLDRTSTSGRLLQIGGTSVDCKTGKQSVVALSTCEAEFVSAIEACKEILWIRCLLKELDAVQHSPTIILQGNQGAEVWETRGIRNTNM